MIIYSITFICIYWNGVSDTYVIIDEDELRAKRKLILINNYHVRHEEISKEIIYED